VFNVNTFTGSDGVLTVSDAEPFDADTFTAYFGEGGVVGRVTDVTVRVTTEIKTFHEMGSHAPRELRPGNIYIRGTVERAFINGSLLRLMLGQYATDEETTPFKIPQFNLKVLLDNLRPAGEEGNSVLTLYGVMFDSWDFRIPEADFVLERLSFQARRISTADTEVAT
jgi:hypothetical protein